MIRYRVGARWATTCLLLVTWPHFSDPPSGFEVKEDPRVGSALQEMLTVAFSFFLDCFLPLFLFVQSFLSFIGIWLSVAFLSCFASACKWQLLHDDGQTRTKWKLLLILLIAEASRPTPRPVHFGGSMPTPVFFERPVPESGEFTLTTSYGDERNMEHAGVRRMLLLMAGLERYCNEDLFI